MSVGNVLRDVMIAELDKRIHLSEVHAERERKLAEADEAEAALWRNAAAHLDSLTAAQISGLQAIISQPHLVMGPSRLTRLTELLVGEAATVEASAEPGEAGARPAVPMAVAIDRAWRAAQESTAAPSPAVPTVPELRGAMTKAVGALNDRLQGAAATGLSHAGSPPCPSQQ